MKPYLIICLVCLILLNDQLNIAFGIKIGKHHQKIELKSNVQTGSIKHNYDSWITPNFIETYTEDLNDNFGFTLTPTINISEEKAKKPKKSKFVERPRFVKFLQKSDKIFNYETVKNKKETKSALEKPEIVKSFKSHSKYIKPKMVNYIQKSEKVIIIKKPIIYENVEIKKENSPNKPNNSNSPKKEETKYQVEYEKTKNEKLSLRKEHDAPHYEYGNVQFIKPQLKMTEGLNEQNPQYKRLQTEYAKVHYKGDPSTAYNFNPIFERIYRKRIYAETPRYVKRLQKDMPVKHAVIPKSFQAVEKVRQLSPAAQADLRIRDFYRE